METRVITLQCREDVRGFPDEQLQAAVKGRRVIHISSHFFIHGNVPQMCIVLLLDDVVTKVSESESTSADRLDSTITMDEDEKKVFASVRAWRQEVARDVQLPNYCIAHNKHLVRIAKVKPTTLEELREVAKMSEKFCSSYGEQVLNVVASAGVQTAKSAIGGSQWRNFSGER